MTTDLASPANRKAQLRAEALARRDALELDDRLLWDEAIVEGVLALRVFTQGPISAYWPMRSEAEFEAALVSKRETTVKLNQHLPVHLVYFTAYPDPRGRISYRRDVYGRDAAIFEALSAAGVELPGVQG